MRFRTTLATLALITIVSAGAVAAVQGLSVKRVPKEGATFKYDLTGSFKVDGTDVGIKSTVQEKVTTVAADGSYTVEQQQLTGSVTVNGSSQDLPSSTTTTTYAPNGVVLSVTGANDPAASMRMTNLGSLIDPGKPVAVGEKWTSAIKEDKDKNIVAATANYELLGEEKIGTIDTLKIKLSIAETTGSDPASNDATVWIDKTDGSVVKMSAAWKNAPSLSGPIDVQIEMMRTP